LWLKKIFFRFPHRRLAVLKQWINNVRREGFKPSKTAVLCSEHFTPDCFDRTGQTVRLRQDVVPTLFSLPLHLHKVVKTRKPPCPRTVNSLAVEMEIAMDTTEGTSATTSTPMDHQYCVLVESPRKVKRKIDSIIVRANSISKKLRLSAQRTRRLRNKVDSLKDIVAQLKEKNLISDNCEEVLSATFAGIPLAVMLRMLKRTQTGKIPRTAYPEALKTFALTLNFYSPKAYSYVRETVIFDFAANNLTCIPIICHTLLSFKLILQSVNLDQFLSSHTT
jgi:hypothetical protein